MTLKEFVQKIHESLKSEGVDPDKQPIDFSCDAINPNDKPRQIRVYVDTANMPVRCSVNATFYGEP